MDPIRFSAEEVLDMAHKDRRKRREILQRRREDVEKDNVRELLNSLAQEEFKHKKYFMELKSSVKKAPLSFDPFTEDASLYVKALADSEVFIAASEGRKFAKELKGEAPCLTSP